MARKNGGFIYPAHAGINPDQQRRRNHSHRSTPHTRG